MGNAAAEFAAARGQKQGKRVRKIIKADTDPVRAAQYIRMSTEHQRYSPDNQQTAIAAYASLRGFEVVETYRSEEHTSELQSLMRISYAVFCLKKKKKYKKK